MARDRERVPRALFKTLEVAEVTIVEALGSHGVIDVEWVVGFVRPFHVSAWLVTSTDRERDALPPQPFRDEVLSMLLDAGPPSDDLGEFDTVAQSQESVDRDYEGSWFYALR